MNNYKEILESIGYINLRDCGNSYRGSALYRDGKSDNSLIVYKDTGQFIDFVTNIKGPFEDLIKLSLDIKTTEEVKTWLESSFDYITKKGLGKPKLKNQIKIFSNNCLAEILPQHDYWINRGISLDILKEFRGGTMFSGRMFNRYVFPIFNSKNNILGIVGRDLTGNSNRNKWKICGIKKHFLFPLFVNYRNLKNNKVILVESIGDCLALFECGIRNVIVTFGIDINSELIKLLVKLNPPEIIISFNNDQNNNKAGNIAAETQKKKLLNYFDPDKIKIKLPESDKDWNDVLLNQGKEQLVKYWQ